MKKEVLTNLFQKKSDKKANSLKTVCHFRSQGLFDIKK